MLYFVLVESDLSSSKSCSLSSTLSWIQQYNKNIFLFKSNHNLIYIKDTCLMNFGVHSKMFRVYSVCFICSMFSNYHTFWENLVLIFVKAMQQTSIIFIRDWALLDKFQGVFADVDQTFQRFRWLTSWCWPLVWKLKRNWQQ